MTPRIAALVGLITALLATLVAPVGGAELAQPDNDYAPRYEWPVSPDPQVTRPFEPPEHPWGPGHRGVDLAAEPGQEVYAAAEGVVVYAGTLAGRGVVSIDHDVLRTTYEPVEPTVAAGDRVYPGQQIGTVSDGHAGCPVAACLHWGVRRGDEYLNPLHLVVPTEIRLKPWDGP